MRILTTFLLLLPLLLPAQDATMARIKAVVADQYPGYMIDETEKKNPGAQGRCSGR